MTDSATQIGVHPVDERSFPLYSVNPATHGLQKTYKLTVPGGSAKQITDTPAYPNAVVGSAAPEIVQWLVCNESAVDLRFGGPELQSAPTASPTGTGVTSPGMPFPAGSVLPQFWSTKSDPGQAYILNPNSGDVEVTVLIVGKF